MVQKKASEMRFTPYLGDPKVALEISENVDRVIETEDPACAFKSFYLNKMHILPELLLKPFQHTMKTFFAAFATIL